MSKKDTIIELVVTVGGVSKGVAQDIVEALQDEGLLVLGYGEKDVDAIVIKFSETFGNTRTSKYDRFAAQRLANKYGSQSVTGIIGLLAKHSKEQFAPIVNSVAQLESKWVSIVNFLQNSEVETPTIKTGKS